MTEQMPKVKSTIAATTGTTNARITSARLRPEPTPIINNQNQTSTQTQLRAWQIAQPNTTVPEGRD